MTKCTLPEVYTWVDNDGDLEYSSGHIGEPQAEGDGRFLPEALAERIIGLCEGIGDKNVTSDPLGFLAMLNQARAILEALTGDASKDAEEMTK